ncbi:hypothetical protein PROFUN_04493 [Planoprotostelium fungivorum]|uniref:Uncharacterized protein n=1 Tax=Planoprotostelium fungivorum TaxID=1890364 RepID=A0A2P6NBD7_9EUKA|nr:hypothetical protein PROFUN_04493 [Planoprotostelium fungivorum]
MRTILFTTFALLFVMAAADPFSSLKSKSGAATAQVQKMLAVANILKRIEEQKKYAFTNPFDNFGSVFGGETNGADLINGLFGKYAGSLGNQFDLDFDFDYESTVQQNMRDFVALTSALKNLRQSKIFDYLATLKANFEMRSDDFSAIRDFKSLGNFGKDNGFESVFSKFEEFGAGAF